MAQDEKGHAAHVQVAENLGMLPAVARPLKIVFLGGGSFFFKDLLIDVMSIPGADVGEMAIVDVDAQRLEVAAKLGEKIIAQMGKRWTLTATTDRRKVLPGAHYIINCIEVSGVQCVRHDNDIPARYGVDQCIGDTIGPGGLFKALRTVPVFIEALHDIERLCPGAWVLNYTNPMSIMCLAAARATRAKVVGLCHSVQGTTRQLAGYAGLPYHEVQWRCGGVNHLAWITEFTHNGRDVYPTLFDKAQNDPETYEKDPVRFDMMQHFGYFITESSGHLSEYLPYYRKRKDTLAKYCRPGYLGGSSFYADGWPKWRKDSDETRRKMIAGEVEIATRRSLEFASYIIEAMETHKPFVIHGNMPNRGLIENLPHDGIVEVACVVNRNGVQPTRFGPLPPHCAAICDWQMRMYDVAAEACVHKSREAAMHALMLDPLTAAVCCPAEIKKMFDELFEAEREFLPGF